MSSYFMAMMLLSGGSFIIKEDTPAMIGRGHWQIEQEIRKSGLDWTFLRPGFFMQNFLNVIGRKFYF